MMRAFALIVFCAALKSISTYPSNGLFREFPQRRTVMFGGYYGQPHSNGRGIPQSMTFASGDSIATNSFVGDRFPQYDFEETTERRKTLQNSDAPISTESDESFVSEETIKSKRLPKRKKPQKPQNNQEEDEDNTDDIPSNWPLQGNRNGMPSYNAFFPIMIGGSGSRTRSSNDEGSYPGSATAIANSFSTGKGGVATSHATSYGDPSLSTLFRNGNLNPGSRKFDQ